MFIIVIIGSHTETVFALREGTQPSYCCFFNSIQFLQFFGIYISSKLQTPNVCFTPVVYSVIACRDGADK